MRNCVRIASKQIKKHILTRYDCIIQPCWVDTMAIGRCYSSPPPPRRHDMLAVYIDLQYKSHGSSAAGLCTGPLIGQTPRMDLLRLPVGMSS